VAKGLCAAHYQQQRRTGRLRLVGEDPRGVRYQSWRDRLVACAVRVADDALDNEAFERALAALRMAFADKRRKTVQPGRKTARRGQPGPER
jgi:hypothetical protein